MKNNQKNAFSWGNYDYSNLSSEISTKIQNLKNESLNNELESFSSSESINSNKFENIEKWLFISTNCRKIAHKSKISRYSYPKNKEKSS